MHAPDGFLNAGTAVATGAISIGTIAAALRHLKHQLREKQVPLAGIAAAFVFAAQMFNFPVAAGTTGHLLGAALAAILLGPSTGVIVVTIVVVVQAFAFADRVKTQDPSVNLSSIYRSLSLFSHLGIVRESKLGSDTASYWEVAHPDDKFHLRCESCGTVSHHTGDLVDQIRTHLREGHGFHAGGVHLYVTGTCDSCISESRL